MYLATKSSTIQLWPRAISNFISYLFSPLLSVLAFFVIIYFCRSTLGSRELGQFKHGNVKIFWIERGDDTKVSWCRWWRAEPWCRAAQKKKEEATWIAIWRQSHSLRVEHRRLNESARAGEMTIEIDGKSGCRHCAISFDIRARIGRKRDCLREWKWKNVEWLENVRDHMSAEENANESETYERNWKDCTPRWSTVAAIFDDS